MNVQLNSVSPTRKDLVVTLEQSEVEAEHQAVIGEFTRQVRLPGFRPGHAPQAIVLRRFGKEIADEFKQKVVARAYRGAIEQEKDLAIVNIVKIDEGTLQPGAAAAITVTVDIRPDFTLPSYLGLETKVEPTEATESDIDAVVEGLRTDRADFKPAERAAQKGDYVKLAYEGTLDGKPILEVAPDKQLYGKVPQTWEEVEGGQEGIIPGLGKHLAGLKAGDRKTVEIAFPAAFAPVPALAGRTASYALEIQEVRERVLPPLDETFFRSQGAPDLAGLRQAVGDNIRRQKELRNLSQQRRQVTEALAAKVDFAAPESMVEMETEGGLRRFIEENLRRGVAPEQFEKDKQQLVEEAKKAAEQRVKLQLILARIAETEKIEVAEDDVDRFINREAGRTGQRPDKLAKILAKDRDQLRSLQQSILFDKTVDFLVSKATVSPLPAGSASA